MILKKKIQKVKTLLSSYEEEEKLYFKIIEMGKELPSYPRKHLDSCYLLKGCQSKTYLRSYLQKEKVFFEGTSDALISKGLLAILFVIYNAETAENILKNPLNCLDSCNILQKLSYNRANGLQQIHLAMKKEALKYILNKPATKDI